MKLSGLLPSFFALMLMSSIVQADVVSFTPSGTSTVSQDTSLYWDMESSDTSTSSFGAVGDFYLSDHGDIHFDTGAGASMVAIGSTQGGALLPLGTPIDASSNWSTSSYVGTTDYQGLMVPPQTSYFGLRFELNGQTHYGWVQIEEGLSEQSVLAWGYETTPNLAIAAGATFGGAASVPTVSNWAMIVIILLLAALAVAQLRRRGTKGV